MLQDNAQSEPGQPVRVLLADRRRLVCSALRRILEETPDIRIVGEAFDLAETQRLTDEIAPDVVVLAALVPFSRFGEAIALIQARRSRTAVLVLSGSDERLNLAVLWAAGAVGVVDETAAPARLIEAIRRAGRGEWVFSREQVHQAQRQVEEVSRRWMDLTPREREVLRLMAEGKSNASMSRDLHIAAKTVEYHVGNILDKLGVSTRVEAALWAIKAEVMHR